MIDPEELLTLVGEIVSAHVSNNSVATSDLPALIKSVHRALANLGAEPAPVEAEKPRGAVSPRASVKPDGLISMIDGKKYQTLRRHVTRHGYTPESYRETFGLPRDYPMVAAAYSEHRRTLAKAIGLGRKPAAAEPMPEAVPESTPEVQEAKQGRKRFNRLDAAAEPAPAAKKRGRAAKATSEESAGDFFDPATEA